MIYSKLGANIFRFQRKGNAEVDSISAKKIRKVKKIVKLRKTVTATLEKFELFFYENYTCEDGEGKLNVCNLKYIPTSLIL